MTKRQITATAPDGTPISVNVGPARQIAAIRITGGFESTKSNGQWLVTVHKTLPNAITGPNQTPCWNGSPRWAIAIDENDQPVGPWLAASK